MIANCLKKAEKQSSHIGEVWIKTQIKHKAMNEWKLYSICKLDCPCTARKSQEYTGSVKGGKKEKEYFYEFEMSSFLEDCLSCKL